MENIFVIDKTYLEKSIFGKVLIDYENNKINEFFKDRLDDDCSNIFEYHELDDCNIKSDFYMDDSYLEIIFYVDRVDIEIEEGIYSEKDVLYYVDENGNEIYKTTLELYEAINNRLSEIKKYTANELEIPYDVRVEELHHDTIKHNYIYHKDNLFLVNSNKNINPEMDFFKEYRKEIKEFDKNEKQDWKSKNFISYLIMSDLESIYSYLKIFQEENKIYIKDLFTHMDFRNKGYATRLIKEALRKSVIEGAEETRIVIKKSNTEAINLVEKLGFNLISKENNYITYNYLKEEVDIIKAFDYTENNISMLSKKQLCGCVNCQSLFSSDSIFKGMIEDTAACPVCGFSGIIGINSGINIDEELLTSMNALLVKDE